MYAPAAILACFFVVTAATESLACGNDIYKHREDALVADLARVKSMLREGRYGDASYLAEGVAERARASRKNDATALVEREARVALLTATIRSNGVFVGQAERGTAQERAAAIRAALDALRAVDPRPRAARELEGEALARLPGSQREARAILEELARKDLVTAAEPWGALAVLRLNAGDDVGAASAKHTCAARAVHASKQCMPFEVPALAVATTSAATSGGAQK